MKSFITPTYVFDASAQTVDLSAIPNFDMKRLVAIINQTDGILIYSTASTSLVATEAAGVVTLAYDTTTMADADLLQIIYEVTPDNVTYAEIVNLTNVAQTFTAPEWARWCKIQADDQNAAPIRVKLGAVATTTSGLQFQPNRSEDYHSVSDISVCCETADINQKIYVQWGI